MDGPGGVILDQLRQDSIPSWIDFRNLILYLLQALMGKNDLREVWESPRVGSHRAVPDATSPKLLSYHGHSHITLLSKASKARMITVHGLQMETEV